MNDARIATRILRFRRLLSIGVQLVIVVAANRGAFSLRFDGVVPAAAESAWRQMLPWLVGMRAAAFVPFGLYQGLWRYTSIYDLRALICGTLLSSCLFWAVLESPLGSQAYPRSIVVIDAAILVILLGGIRLMHRLLAEARRITRAKRVLIFGAGDAGELIVRDMKRRQQRQRKYQPVGFIDDDRSKVGRRIHGVPVLGDRGDLHRVVKERHPDEILIAIPRANAADIRSIVRTLEVSGIAIKTLPKFSEIIDGKVSIGQIRNLSFEDLLSRAPVGVDRRALQPLLRSRRVMVTGAGGSIGSELCRQIASVKPSLLLLFDRYENGLHAIRLELEDAGLGRCLVPVLGDITDQTHIDDVLRSHRPELIFHAAAHKHVGLMEENPCEAIKNNVWGTRLLASAAERFGVDRFIYISTDKAVNPKSVMGASKRVAELVIQRQALGSGTSFAIVRFGNVLGSNGSVVPRFQEQIRRGGPVTITHPDVRRFFMLPSEAVQLVLHAASRAERGATYVLDMGEQVRLVEIARHLIRSSGLVPDEDVRIEFVGLRAGEKLSEELVGRDETAEASGVDQILRVHSVRPPPPDFLGHVMALEGLAAASDAEGVLGALRALLGTFDASEHEAPVIAVAHSSRTSALTMSGVRCPSCDGRNIQRSRARTRSDRLWKYFTVQRPFRCGSCGWRGWLHPPGEDAAPLAEGGRDPDLSAIDGAFQVVNSRRVAFSPRELA